MSLYTDVKNLKASITRKAASAANARQLHFDSVAIELGYADAQKAFNALGKAFLEKAKKNAPSISK